MNKIISVLLTLVMLLTVIPFGAHAENGKASAEEKDEQLIVVYYNSTVVISAYEFANIDVVNYHPAHVEVAAYNKPELDRIISYSSSNALGVHRRIALEQNPDIKFLFTMANMNLSCFESWFQSEAYAERLADAVMIIVEKYGYDGFDIDYEFPTGSDTLRKNFVYFMSVMRQRLDEYGRAAGKECYLSMAVPGTQWAFSLFDINALAEYVDYFNLMNYDLYINHNVTHHHTPPYDNDASTGFIGGSVYSDIQLYLERGVPAEKIVAGCGLYSLYYQDVANVNNGLYQPGTRVTNGSQTNIHYTELLANYINKNGFVRYWDESAQAPYLYNAERGHFITYDDEQSVEMKCKIVAEEGVRGIMVFDYCTCDGIGLFDKMRGWLEEYSFSFDDVDAGAWYFEPVKYCYDETLMKGVGDTAFNPKGKVTREQFVQALANLEGVDTGAYAEDAKNTPFKDVKAGAWYSNAVEWARHYGIVAGVSDTAFGIGAEISREQMATMLVRYARYKGTKTDYSFSLESFGDSGDIAEWALEGVKYAAAFGLFKGDENSMFKPKGVASRAELATVLMRIHKIKNSRILCWGDSLTAGIETGPYDFVDVPYPERMGEYLGTETVNLGIGSEHSDMIAMRQGGIKLYVNRLTIPSECKPVMICPKREGDDTIVSFCLYGVNGVNDAEIAGVRGRIVDKDGNEIIGRDNNDIYFMRNEPGEAVYVDEPTPIYTRYTREKRDDDILVIWAGSNDLYGASDVSLMEEINANIQAMVDFAGTDEYIIVGYTANMYLGTDSFRECTDLANIELEKYWGDKYIDIKEYMATEQVLIDHGITPTERDMEFIAKGWIPPSLLEDSNNLIHFNQTGYDIVADMIAEKIVELGYLG